MKIKLLISIIMLLAVGVYVGTFILNATPKIGNGPSDNESNKNPTSHIVQAGSLPKGTHGGWLLYEKNLMVEIKIFEKNVAPEFRVYITEASGKDIPLNEVKLTIKLHRLDRVNTIQFIQYGRYLRGDKTVDEPHSFIVEVRAIWKQQIYEWRFSQIEARTELLDIAIKNANITIKKALSGRLKSQINLQGEIGLNEEKVVHIVPRLDGVVKRTFKDLGDRVIPGDILAIIESRELVNAKIEFLSNLQQVDLSKSDLDREVLLLQNTTKMLDLLKKQLSVDNIYKQLKDLQIGKSRELLIPAYAKLKLASSVFQREKILFEKGISSELEYLQAEENLKSSEAKYMAVGEKIDYDGKWSVRQKKRNLEIGILNLKIARQKLFALGLLDEDIETISYQDDQDFSRYELLSPIKGIIIQKHLTTGEAVKNDDDVFLLADLSEVWVNIAIPITDLNLIQLGQNVTVHQKVLGLKTIGELTFLGSIIGETSRTVTGRVVISNPKSEWRPGTFVTLEVTLDERVVPIVVPTRAIQTIRNWSVVFVKYGNYFEARPLKLGESDGNWTEILEGLKQGESFVDQNSFTIKAEIEKSSASHDH